MSTRTVPPFRADHVGSLLRPEWLHAARAERAAGRISAEELRAVEDRAVLEAVELQRSVGLRSVTDGEFRRATWHMDFVYQIGGIGKAPGNLVSTFHNEGGDIEFTPDAIRVGRRVSMDKTIFGEDFAFLQSVAGDSVPKLTIPVHRADQRGDRRPAATGVPRRPEAPDRGGVGLRAARPALPFRAVRLRLHRRGERPHRR